MINSDIKNKILKSIKGDVLESGLENYSTDKSIFKILPQLVIYPQDEEDIKNLVKIAKENNFYLTPRAAGTDMSGGSIGDSLLLVFTKYFNKIIEIDSERKYVIAQPGVYFRDLEKELDKVNIFLPSYPASKEICALGGMIANDSGGEKTIKYGKTHDYVEGLNVVLSDGNEYYLEKIEGNELNNKLNLSDFEGEIYRKTYSLLKNNFDLIQRSRPKVSKNSAGYNIWDAYGYEKGKEFLDLTKLFVGSQGTLGIITKIKLRLVEKPQYKKLAVIFLKDLNQINIILDDLLKLKPDSLEITDDHTFKIFLKYAREMAEILGFKGLFSTFKLFLPEIKLILKNGIPKLIILVEFEGKSEEDINNSIFLLKEIILNKKIPLIICQTETEEQKYWKIRRDTYKLLREKIKDKIAAPFVDDIIVDPHYLSEFLPQLIKILDKYQLLYTISGHLGDGNLHIIPLLDLKKEREKIFPAMEEVYGLTLKYNGSITAEHNDGLIRGWYLEKMYGKEIFNIFLEIKKIFDPENIFNRYKKVQATREYSFKHLLS
ncbi:MAG: FAD-binding oxidoreductase [Patescibacteria group bacterium]|nr:FAD-binding oxidoreductase [Patescibacteria group bacterium]